jgi:radical SAM family uncharacterized protein
MSTTDPFGAVPPAKPLLVVADPSPAAPGHSRSAQYDPAPLAALTVERVLGRVRKPGRYAGGEWNSVAKEWGTVAVKWCFAYPDLYEIGMSNLGLRILYEVLNDRPDRLAERCYAPDVDLADQLRGNGVRLWSLETRRSLSEFDVLGFSLGYELIATNLLEMLDLAGVGLTSAGRRPDDPLVIAGGSNAMNPEPIADFLDAVVLGEGEEVVLAIGDTLERIGWNRRVDAREGEWRRGVDRATALRELARLPGVYVPSLYKPRHAASGELIALDRAADDVPRRITAGIVADFETNVRGIRQLVPNIGIVFDRAQLEVMRGCTRGCRFCQAGMQYRPLRERAPDVAIAAAESILAATGYEEIGLTSLSTADYSYVREVATALRASRPAAILSLPSTRVDAFTVDLVDALATNGRKSGFTFAPEAGSQRMRDIINKGVDDDEILACAALAFGRGWTALKLYFMVGLPGETMEDVMAIAELCHRVLDLGRKRHGNRASVKASLSTFVPKVGTPFQWFGQDTTEEIEAKVEALRKVMHARGLAMAWHDPNASILEAAIGRGDRRLSPVIRRAWQNGARFDAWDEHFDYSIWRGAFAAEGLDPAWYAQRDIPLDEPLAWQHLTGGADHDFLVREYKRAEAAATTADCHWGPCENCGVSDSSGFDCRTGARGPRALLKVDGRWRYVGPPGDPRREPQPAGVPAGRNAAAADPLAARAASGENGRGAAIDRDPARLGRPHDIDRN